MHYAYALVLLLLPSPPEIPRFFYPFQTKTYTQAIHIHTHTQHGRDLRWRAHCIDRIRMVPTFDWSGKTTLRIIYYTFEPPCPFDRIGDMVNVNTNRIHSPANFQIIFTLSWACAMPWFMTCVNIWMHTDPSRRHVQPSKYTSDETVGTADRLSRLTFIRSSDE